MPDTQLSLAGPVVRPEPGQLPLRGDLAHIALAHRYLVAHYVVPEFCMLTDNCVLHVAPAETADEVTELAAGQDIELLDIAGEWAWVCLSSEGPAGYVPLSVITQ